jgi:hypothetical protein
LTIDRSQQKKEKRPRPPQVAASHGEQHRFCQLTQARNDPLTDLSELPFNGGNGMANDPLAKVRTEVGLRIAEIRERGLRLSPLDLYSRMDAIRQLAAVNGLAALESLARHSAQIALLPGYRVAMQSCLEHVDEAIDCRSERDRTAILAAVAVRLH